MEKEGRDGEVAGGGAITVAASPSKKRSSSSGGSTNIFRAALLMMRRRSARKNKQYPAHPTDLIDSSTLDLVVKGMRPVLHLQRLTYTPPPPPPAGLEFHDVALPPPSPACSDIDGMSRYASAEDLQALDMSEEGEAPPAAGELQPNAIDVKAEEFIAKFYEQMRLQITDSSVGEDGVAGEA